MTPGETEPQMPLQDRLASTAKTVGKVAAFLFVASNAAHGVKFLNDYDSVDGSTRPAWSIDPSTWISAPITQIIVDYDPHQG